VLLNELELEMPIKKEKTKKKSLTPPTSRKSIFSRPFEHTPANFDPILSSIKRLGPVA